MSFQEFLQKVRAAAPAESAGPARWSRTQLAGRLVEVSAIGAVGSMSAAVGVVLEAQVEGEPVAWISLPSSIFYPPDLADSGIDLDALIVVRAPSTLHAGRAADRLLRSGGFGLVVLDLGAEKSAELPMAMQGRLVGLAQRHDAAILCLTEKPQEAASLGSMVSLRAEALRVREGDGFRITLRAIKDKQRGPGWSHGESLRGPAGL